MPFDIDAHVSLIHDPRNEYYKLYSVAHLGNVVEGFPIRYVNVPIDVLREAATKSIDSDKPVWFDAMLARACSASMGCSTPNMYDFKSAFGTEFGMDKKTRLLYGESLMTHAMVLTAYDREQAEGVGAGSGEAEAEEEAKSKDDGDKKDKKKKELNAPTEGAGAIRAWRVENSWGTDKADKGYLCMTDEWFGNGSTRSLSIEPSSTQKFSLSSTLKPSCFPHGIRWVLSPKACSKFTGTHEDLFECMWGVPNI